MRLDSSCFLSLIRPPGLHDEWSWTPLMNRCFNKYRGERGYVLLILLLAVSLLSIGFLTVIEGIDFQIKRDQEEELIHRGLEYSRAVRRYVKQFGRYPNSVEALENSNHVRFLRKRYKDPITGKDFRVLHYGDLETFYSGAPVGAGVSALKSSTANAQAGGGPPPYATTTAGNVQGSASNAPTGTSQSDDSDAIAQVLAQQPVEADPRPQTETDPGQDAGGGMAIIGVSSYSKRKSIRVFNKKDHYNQWQFVYDPSTDTGVMRGPNQPLLRVPSNTGSPQSGQSPVPDPGMSGPQK